MDKKETLLGEMGKKIPIDKVYDDLLHPAISQVGDTLKGTVELAVAPLTGMIWGYHKIADYLDEAIPRYFEERRISKKKIISPDIDIAVPVMEALRYANKNIIKEMFVNILGASMNLDTCDFVHPSFVEIIKQLTPDEAKILKVLPEKGLCEPLVDIEVEKKEVKGRFVLYNNYGILGYEAGCDNPDRISLYIDNLQRLALVKVPEQSFLIDEWRYDKIVNSEGYKSLFKTAELDGEVFYVKRMIGLTDYGAQLKEICLS